MVQYNALCFNADSSLCMCVAPGRILFPHDENALPTLSLQYPILTELDNTNLQESD